MEEAWLTQWVEESYKQGTVRRAARSAGRHLTTGWKEEGTWRENMEEAEARLIRQGYPKNTVKTFHRWWRLFHRWCLQTGKATIDPATEKQWEHEWNSRWEKTLRQRVRILERWAGRFGYTKKERSSWRFPDGALPLYPRELSRALGEWWDLRDTLLRDRTAPRKAGVNVRWAAVKELLPSTRRSRAQC